MLVKALLGFAIALFLTYPAAVLTTIIEGQSAAAIYSFHLPTSIFSYLIFAIPVFYFLFRRHSGLPCKGLSRINLNILLIIIITVYSFFVFNNLGHADILGDDYDLAYQAYNLQDGIMAARKAYIISFNTHPPLFMTIKHYWFQMLFPNGLETVPAWGYRGMEGIMGIGVILAVYAITKNYLASTILAVNNYMVFLGRVYLREMYLTFFITLSIYFFQKKKYLITAFLVACGLLIKTSAIVILPVYLLILLYRKDFKNIFKILSVILIIYSPVIIYNLLAFTTTGHMDATFSKIFGLPHPFLTGSSPPLENIVLIFNYLKDIYSLPLLLIFVSATVSSLFKRQNLFYILMLISSLIYFIFAGPIREYYLLFLTILFAIILSHSGLPKILLVILILFSFYYSISGLSNSRKIYESAHGWPELVSKVSQVYKVGDCLENGNGINDLAMRAYFQTNDTPKKMLLGPNYPHFYKMCDEVSSPNQKISIYYNQLGRISFR